MVDLVERYCKEQGLFRTRRHARPGVHRYAGAGPGHGGAQPGRAEAPAGPRRPEGDEATLSRARWSAPVKERGYELKPEDLCADRA